MRQRKQGRREKQVASNDLVSILGFQPQHCSGITRGEFWLPCCHILTQTPLRRTLLGVGLLSFFSEASPQIIPKCPVTWPPSTHKCCCMMLLLSPVPTPTQPVWKGLEEQKTDPSHLPSQLSPSGSPPCRPGGVIREPAQISISIVAEGVLEN